MSDLIERQSVIDAVDIGNLHRGIVEALQSIISELPSAQPEPHGVCMDCLMKNVCRFKTGLGDYGYCSQWRGEEHG